MILLLSRKVAHEQDTADEGQVEQNLVSFKIII